jgi:hypothetical protein
MDLKVVSRKTGFSYQNFLNNFSYFSKNLAKYFTDFYEGSINFIPPDVMEYYKNLKSESNESLSKLTNKKFFEYDFYHDLIDILEEVASYLETVENGWKYSRSLESNKGTANISVQKRDSLNYEDIVARENFSSDFDNDWQDVTTLNGLFDEDYTTFEIPDVTLPSEIKKNKVTTYYDYSEGINYYGKDIDMDFAINPEEATENKFDIKVKNHVETLEQTALILLTLKRGDLKENSDYGVSSVYKSIGTPTFKNVAIASSIPKNFALDNLFKSCKIRDTRSESDYTIITADLVVEGENKITVINAI